MKNWICAREFSEVEPISLFKKELDEIEMFNKHNSFQNMHVLFRKKFHLNKTSLSYHLHITADDYYKLYINGNFVGQGPAPSYHSSYNYNIYDITNILVDGDNTIAVHCYYQGLVNRVWNSDDLRQGLYASLYKEDELLLTTDGSWKYTYDTSFKTIERTMGYDTQFVENIDMRERITDWKCSDFDDSAWGNAYIKENDDHTMVEQVTPPLDVYEVSPENILCLDNHTFILDFGKEIVAGLKLVAKGERGSKIRLLCGEELKDNGHVRYEMRCNVCYDETWTLSGELDEIENYDYKGFRYLEVKSEDIAIKPNQLSAMVRHYPLKHKISFHSSSDQLNKIWDICENAVIISSQEGFLDCPTREKGQYLGDLTVTALSHTYTNFL